MDQERERSQARGLATLLPPGGWPFLLLQYSGKWHAHITQSSIVSLPCALRTSMENYAGQLLIPKEEPVQAWNSEALWKTKALVLLLCVEGMYYAWFPI